jgi:hypothetical protein
MERQKPKNFKNVNSRYAPNALGSQMLSEEQKKKAVEDLYAPLENHLTFSKAAFDIAANYKYIEELGKQILSHNMKYCKEKLGLPPFDPDSPYEDYECKNLYFSAANNLCQYSLWRHGLYNFAERYYREMLETIKQFEDDTYNHNKGMVYANLGISQAIQLKIDEGFANILKALDEDRGYFEEGKKPTEEFFNTKLFLQLEKIIVLDSLMNHVIALKNEGETCPTAEEFLKGLLDPDQRIFFEYTYAKILENHNVWKEKPNRFSANRLIAYLQDLCLFAEDFLKRKGYSGMLNNLISSAFSGIYLSGCGADSYEDLNDKLEKMYGEANKKDRALRMLLTMRNFSSHNISAGESGDFILKNFAEVFTEILRAVICIYNLPQISRSHS